MILKRSMASGFIFTVLLLLASCSFNPFSTDNELTGQAVPTVAGGAIGAGSMALLGGSKYAIGLAGLGGATLGYYLSTLKFASGGVDQVGGQVYTQGDYITIEFPTDKIFEENTADILPEATPALQSTVNVLKRYPNNNILVSGNTSGFGTNRWERTLSEKRAREVAAYLWAHGVNAFKGGPSEFDPSSPARALSYVGYGDYFPISNNIKAASIRENSRIQITGYPSRRQLKLCDDQKVFANMGGAIETPIASSAPVSSTGNGYKDEPLEVADATVGSGSNPYNINDNFK